MTKFLTNKWVLNIVAVLALFNVIGYMTIGNINAVAIFIILGILVRYFSKNMILVLGIPLIVVNLLAARNSLEGMENNTSSTNNTNTQEPTVKPAAKAIKKNVAAAKAGSLTVTPVESSETTEQTETTETTTEEPTTTTETDGFEAGRKKSSGHSIDYASTVEDAYSELNQILGSDGIKRLTDDTQSLVKQQMQLAEAMKGMTPVIETIGPMVKNLQGMMGQMGANKEGLGSIMDLAKQFSSQSSPVTKTN